MGRLLDELEQDALAELGNIGVGKASTALSRMVGETVLISVPNVEIVPGDHLATVLERALPGPLVAVSECLSGTFRGSAILLLPEHHSLPLASAALPPDVPKEDAAELEAEALAEVGNIVLNSCLSSMANLLGTGIGTTLPDILRGPVAQVLKACGLDTAAGSSAILFQVTFRIESQDIGGEILLALDAESAEELKATIARYIGRILN